MGFLSVLLGSYGGLNQTSFLRLIGYSTIADMGYIFIALSFGNFIALHAAMIYFFLHLLLSVTLFSFLSHFHSYDNYSFFNSIKDFSFLKQQTYLNFTPLIAMVSYMSIPPLAGFFGKTYIWGMLIHQGCYFILFGLCLAFLASTFFYSRIIRNLFFYSEYQFASFILMEDLSYADLFIVATLNIIFLFFINHFISYTLSLTQYFFIML
jgi:NADH-quinone oxidoreductase subunit N